MGKESKEPKLLSGSYKMPLNSYRVFIYRGRNCQGQYIEGRVRAENNQWAKYKLRKKGIKIQSLQKSWDIPFRTQAIKASDITQLNRQLSILLKAGIPIRRSFDIIASNSKKTCIETTYSRY
jgi:type II secretory pathway component PulF